MHENHIWRIPCCSTLLYLNVSFIAESRHLRSSTVQKFLTRVTRIRSTPFLFIWSEKGFFHFKLYTTYPQEKSNHKKSHSYLADSEHSTCLLKKYPRPQHLPESEDLLVCKTPDVFFWLIFHVSSPPPRTTLRFLHFSSINLQVSMSSISIHATTFFICICFLSSLEKNCKSNWKLYIKVKPNIA